MEFKQIYDFVNKVNKQAWGVNAPEVIDATGLIATGDLVISSANNTDIWTRSMMDVMSDQFVANRKRTQKTYSNIYKTSFEFGAYLEKIIVKVPDAKPESAWTLADGQELKNPTAVFPDVEVKLFASHDVYRFDITLPIDQLKSAFMSAEKFAAFIAAIELEMENKMDASNANLARVCVNNFIAEKVNYEKENAGEGVHAINLLAVYNEATNAGLTIAKAMTDANFIRWATAHMNKYIKRLGDDSTVFNINGLNRQTDKEHLNFIVHSEFIANAATYLQSDTFHNELVKLGDAYQETNFWQSTGKTYDFADTAKIQMITSDGNEIVVPCVLAVAFDVDALGVNWEYKKMRNFYSPEYDVNHQIHSVGVGFFNDYGSENGIVFYMEEV